VVVGCKQSKQKHVVEKKHVENRKSHRSRSTFYGDNPSGYVNVGADVDVKVID
jgi:hypothetical protein